jgi:hypothetical protein
MGRSNFSDYSITELDRCSAGSHLYHLAGTPFFRFRMAHNVTALNSHFLSSLKRPAKIRLVPLVNATNSSSLS